MLSIASFYSCDFFLLLHLLHSTLSVYCLLFIFAVSAREAALIRTCRLQIAEFSIYDDDWKINVSKFICKSESLYEKTFFFPFLLLYSKYFISVPFAVACAFVRLQWQSFGVLFYGRLFRYFPSLSVFFCWMHVCMCV